MQCDLCGIEAESKTLHVDHAGGYRHCDYCAQILDVVKQINQGSANAGNVRLIRVAVLLLHVFEQRLADRMRKNLETQYVEVMQTEPSRGLAKADYSPPTRRGRPKGSLNKPKKGA